MIYVIGLWVVSGMWTFHKNIKGQKFQRLIRRATFRAMRDYPNLNEITANYVYAFGMYLGCLLMGPLGAYVTVRDGVQY